MENMHFKIITLDTEIKIIGLSYHKLGLPETIESLTEMWKLYGEKYRRRVPNAVEPPVDYGVNTCLSTKEDEYIAGCAVTEFGELPEDWASFTVPPGRYIKHSRHDIGDLFKYEQVVKVWAEENQIVIGSDCMIEIYPLGAFAEGDSGAYTLYPIQA